MSALVNDDDCESDVADECAIPSFVNNFHSELPTSSNKTLSLIIQEKQDHFRTALGLTPLAYVTIFLRLDSRYEFHLDRYLLIITMKLKFKSTIC